MRRLTLIILIFLLLPPFARAEAGKYIFEHFPVSTHWINALYQDRDGFLWVASRTGLYRYTFDGVSDYDIVYDRDGCANILQAPDGRLWVRNTNGYIIYDPRTRNLTDEAGTARELDSQTWIDVLDIDRSGNFWWNEDSSLYCRPAATGEKVCIETAADKVYDIFCRDNVAYVMTVAGEVLRYTFDADGHLATLPSLNPGAELAGGSLDYRFFCVFVDSHQNIWLSQGARGVWLIKAGSGKAIHLQGGIGDREIPDGFICAIEEDADGNVWLASDHGGISICSRDGEVIARLRSSSTDDNTIASNGVYALYRDSQDNIWVAYSKKGLSVWRGRNKSWSMNHIDFLHRHNVPDDINTICEDSRGNLWLGTDGSGLFCVDAAGRETAYTVDNSPLCSNVITDLFCDSRGRVWIGTFYGGMSCIENGTMRTWSYKADGSELASENIWSFCEDLAGRIWIGTLGGGLQSYDPYTGEFQTYNSRTSGLSNDYISEMKLGPDGKIYISTSYDLSVFDPRTRTLRVVPVDDSVIHRGQSGLEVDPEGRVWMDEDGSLQVYDPSAERFHTPSSPALNNVRSILSDASGAIWVVTDNGLSQVSLTENSDGQYDFSVTSYSFPQEKDLHFNQRSACLLSDGNFVIGSFCGYLRFSPALIGTSSLSDIKVHFTELYLGNTQVLPGQEYDGHIILDQALEYTQSIVLRHDQSRISIGFTCMDFLSIREPGLYYRLEGLSDEWISVDKGSRRLTFANISPGRYTLRLSPDITSPDAGIALSVRILPSPWATWWAILIYIVLGYGLITLVFILLMRSARIKREIAENALRQERRHYLDEMKMQFFTNVSHDFRTPLTLILTPIEEKMNAEPQLRNDKFITTIYRNAQRLLNLVNEVLDIRRMEMYGNELQLQSSDIVRTVRDVASSFELMASGQGVTLKTETSSESIVFDFDPGKMTKILTNLLSNAFKFTPSGGTITISVSSEEGSPRSSDDSVSGQGTVILKVADTGCGISDKDKKRVFDRFYQAADSQSGSGIGLHVVKEFVSLHGGDISVCDNQPCGSIFTITLPFRPGTVSLSADKEASTESTQAAGETTPSGNENASASPGERSTVLVVDDNDDFRSFLSTALSGEYNVISAADGTSALGAVDSHDVDVVVCDVMMPGMDGNEFCRRMKSSLDTSHIPVILLTAKALQEDEYAGLEAGADDYLTKPFNMSILKLKLARFIQWKQRTKRMFEQELEITTEQMTLTPMDDRLLQNAINIINENISNPDFSVADLSSALHMHRTSLYKKLVYITGKTPVEFIRSIRLKRAAVLLQTDGVYVSEVAYMVGFNSPKVFAGHFRDEFGCSPTEYRKKMCNTTTDNQPQQ